MGQTLSIHNAFLRLLSIFSATSTPQPSQRRTKQEWKAWRAEQKACREVLCSQNKLLTMPQSKKAVERKHRKLDRRRKEAERAATRSFEDRVEKGFVEQEGEDEEG
jgi:hypothetical protein